NYVLWSSRLLCYAKSRPNGKLIYNSIINGPYVRRMIPEPGDQNREVPVNETFHEKKDDGLTKKELKHVEADDQAIHTILLGLPEDIYAAVDSCETAQEIWLIAQPGMNMGQDRQMQMVGGNGGNQFRQYAGQNNGLIVVLGIANQNPNRSGDVVAARAEGNVIGRSRNSTQAEELNKLDAAADHDEIEESQAKLYFDGNCISIDNPIEPIPEPHQVQQNDSNVISEVSSMEQDGGTVDQHLATVEETHAYFESLYNNLAIEVEKVNSVNRKMKETNADLTTELARYKNQEKCFEIRQHKYDKLERCYQKSVYQEQCLTKKINALHLNFGKQITTLNEEISNLNKQLSKEKSNVSSLLEEKKKLMSDFKIREDELLDKQIQLENKIKELDNILVKTEAAKFVQDFKSLAKEADESLAKHKALELEIKLLLRVIVSQDILSIVQRDEYAKLWNDWYKTCEECKYDKISYDKAYNDKQQKIERLQAQLGDQKGKSKDTPCVSNTLDPLSQKLENENVELEFQFSKQSILEKPLSSSKPKLYVVTLFPKSMSLPKIDKTHSLSKLVTSNSVPTPQESKVMKNDKVIALGMFRINPFKPSREDKYVPNKVRASVRTNPITALQPHVITKKDVNSDSNGSSSTGVDDTDKTKRPQPRSNTKNDRVPSASKSSCSKNNEVEVEVHPRNFLLSKNKKHISSKCNHVKLAIWNDKSEIICAMCKQCLITTNHDVCVLNYVNDMNSRVERRNRTLVEAARAMLIFSRTPLFLWAEVIATACYTQNRSIIHLRFNKTPYELINGRKPDMSFLHVFRALYYPKNDREDIGKLGVKAIAFDQSSSKLGLQSMTSGKISSGLDLTYAPSIITSQQPTKGELDLLFEAIYDDHIGGQPSAALRTVPAAQAP
ncbi:retrovirus-related pol polyprotein from transposon TNT 1-94, partial [Tanacetum coccineum]